jgi:hypothetical protein
MGFPWVNILALNVQRGTVPRYAERERSGPEHPPGRKLVRILLTGSRNWRFPATIAEAILTAAVDFTVLLDDITVVHGDCPTGADRHARLFVESHPSLRQERHPADWHRHGRRAGYVRNVEMVALGADLCLGFPRGHSPGTRMALKLARGAGIPRRVYVDEAHDRLAIVQQSPFRTTE